MVQPPHPPVGSYPPPAPGGGWPQGPAPGWPPPKKPTSPLVIIAIIVGGVFFLGILAGVASYSFRRYVERAEAADASPSAEPRGEVVRSSDERGSLTVPSSWRTHLKLNDSADIQVGKPIDDLYLVVVSEPKVDFVTDVGLEGYADIVFGHMQKVVAGFERSEPESLRVGGRPALQYEVRGSVDKLRLVYLVTFIDGPERFHQVSAWTSHSRFDAARAELHRITSTFRELPPP